jgi:hypothetical protein
MGYTKGGQEWLTAWDVPKNSKGRGEREEKEAETPEKLETVPQAK